MSCSAMRLLPPLLAHNQINATLLGILPLLSMQEGPVLLQVELLDSDITNIWGVTHEDTV